MLFAGPVPSKWSAGGPARKTDQTLGQRGGQVKSAPGRVDTWFNEVSVSGRSPGQPPPSPRALVVDDETIVREVVAQILRVEGMEVEEADCAERAL